MGEENLAAPVLHLGEVSELAAVVHSNGFKDLREVFSVLIMGNRSIIPRYRKAVVPSTHTAENHDFISSDQGSRSSTSKSLLRSARSGNLLSR